MRLTLMSVLVGSVCACLVHGQTLKPPAKMIAAQTDYEQALGKLKETSDNSAQQAATDYKTRLAAILEEATKSGNLDGALVVREEIKRVESGVMLSRRVATKADLKKFLEGTQWKWDGDPLILKPNGVVRHLGWDY